MSDYPEFWNKILAILGLESFAGVDNVAKVLTFLGYTTAASISKLRKEKELNLFQIEVSKLGTNANFRAKYPELENWELGHGSLQVLKDISNAAASCASWTSDDLHSVERATYERCIKVAPNLVQSDVMVNLDGKPCCEIICPFDFCRQSLSLGITKQTNPFARPKFNPNNFERHIKTQHENKKRKIEEEPSLSVKRSPNVTILESMSCEISSINGRERYPSFYSFLSAPSSTPVRQNLGTLSKQSQVMTPKTTKICMLKEQLNEANDKIRQLETIQSGASSSSSSSVSVPPSSLNLQCATPKSARIEKLQSDLDEKGKITDQLHKENIALKHKLMDSRGTIRTFIRIKPDVDATGNCFDWRCNGPNIEIASVNCEMDHIFLPDKNNEDVFVFTEPLLVSALEGYNVCIMAYGASGSGKSYTMTGSDSDFGLIQRSIEYLLHAMDGRYKFTATFFEIYNESFIDLFGNNTKPITIQGEKVTNLQSIEIDSVEQFNTALKESIDRRKKSATSRNTNSSRSHAVLQIELEGLYADQHNKIIKSSIMFLDLAGCEKADDHINNAEGSQRQTEMTNINQSVGNVRNVIESLKKGEVADFRSSKLTHLLKPCLTQNTKTLLLATISQETKYLSSSKETLRLAKSAGHIQIKGVKKNLHAVVVNPSAVMRRINALAGAKQSTGN